MDKQWNKDELTFIDSWKDKELEIAATSAIIVGAGVMAAKGNLPEVKRGAQAAGKLAGKGFERYVKRSANPTIRNFYNVGSNAYKNLKKGKMPTQQETVDEFLSKSQNRINSIKDEKLDEAWKKRYAEKISGRQAEIDEAIALGKPAPAIDMPDPVRVKEEVRLELVQESLEKPVYKQNRNNRAPIFKPRELATDAVSAGVAGIGFGAGITAYHALNDSVSPKDKTRDKTFQAAGSYRKTDNRRGDQMKKQAGVEDVYNGLASLGKKVPSAAATGLGFTGVSLGAAHVLNKRKQEEDGPTKNRIIIELGEEDPLDKSHSSHATAGGMNLLPRADFNKSASAKDFLKNIGGRSTELRQLENRIKDFDYKAEAANSLQGKPVNDLAKERYGHIFEGEKANERLWEEEANTLQNKDKDAQRKILHDVAVDRMKGLGGLGLAGLGAGGASAVLHKDKEEPVNGGYN